MRDKNKPVKSKTRKRPLISAAIGIAIAILAFICCFILVPLGLFTAAVFLHKWRVPLIIAGIVIAAVSIFFALRGKEIFCICKVLKLWKKHKKLIIISLGVILCISLIIFSTNFFKTFSFSKSEKATLEWKNNKVESDLVRIVNFLENNKGKYIELAGEKHIITSKEELSIKIVMLECCTKSEFDDILGSLSKIGVVRGSDFDKKEIQADIPVDEISKIADIWNVERIELEPKSEDIWIQLIK